MIKKVIIIGGAGYLGSNIARVLDSKKNLELSYADVAPNPVLNHDFIKIDLLEPSTLDQLKAFDVVINCSGQLTTPFNLCYRLNTDGIYNIIENIISPSNRLLQISTVAVYGTRDYCDELSPLNPETNYAMAKAAAESQILLNLPSANFSILRLSNLYGGAQTRGIISYILKSLFTDRQLHFNNNGNLKRSYIHVEDASEFIAGCVLEPNLEDVYNLKGPDSFTVIDLIDIIEKEFDVVFKKEFTDIRPWENINYIDDSSLHNTLNLGYKYDLISYIKEVLKNN